MTTFNLERVSILVVDDSAFMRSLLTRVFHVLGARQIQTAEDGQAAIEALRSAAGDRAAGPGGIDLIVSDYFMEPLDGLMLLRWVRRSKDTPDRFMPFFMVSAAADRDIVAEARDAGVTEFIGKPFSVSSILSKIAGLIDQPRQFVFTAAYFGPDRRRQNLAFGAAERRTITEDEIRIVYADTTPARDALRTAKVWLFRPTNAIKRKIGVGAGSGSATIDPALVESAESQISELSDDYADWVRDSVAELAREHSHAVNRPDEAPGRYRAIHKLALELRGQGGMFDYPLVTEFGASLYQCTGGSPRITHNHLALVKAHIDAIRAVINDKVSGDGGVVGRALVAGLAQAKEKYASP